MSQILLSLQSSSRTCSILKKIPIPFQNSFIH
nr:MAG TPA: hypothetical protein [Caudoviricetes sp.]